MQRLFASAPAAQERLRRHYILLAENLEYRFGGALTRAKIKDQVSIKAYAYGDNGYTESQSFDALLPARKWQRASFELPHGTGCGPIRIDPTDMPAIIEIAEIHVSKADDGQLLWQAKDLSGFDEIRFNNEIQVLPRSDHFRLASYGFDPQMVLPEIPGAAPRQSLCVVTPPRREHRTLGHRRIP